MKAIFSRLGLLVAVVLTLIAGILALNFATGEKKIEQSVERLYAAADPAFTRAMGVLLGPAILQGNRFEALLNGDRIFPAMLASIRDARKTITFESYIYWSDAIGKEFADALAERARAGVKVHVLLDWVGSNKMDPTHLAAMEAAGVEVRKFHKPAWYSLARMNNRTHRKVLVVARRQVEVFNADLSRSRRVSLHEWQQRPLAEKFVEHAASLIGAQL